MQSCFGGAAAQGPRDQRSRAPWPDVAENRLVRQRVAAEFLESCVDRQGQVELGINQRAVQIEDQRAHFGKTGQWFPHEM